MLVGVVPNFSAVFKNLVGVPNLAELTSVLIFSLAACFCKKDLVGFNGFGKPLNPPLTPELWKAVLGLSWTGICSSINFLSSF